MLTVAEFAASSPQVEDCENFIREAMLLPEDEGMPRVANMLRVVMLESHKDIGFRQALVTSPVMRELWEKWGAAVTRLKYPF